MQAAAAAAALAAVVANTLAAAGVVTAARAGGCQAREGTRGGCPSCRRYPSRVSVPLAIPPAYASLYGRCPPN